MRARAYIRHCKIKKIKRTIGYVLLAIIISFPISFGIFYFGQLQPTKEFQKENKVEIQKEIQNTEIEVSVFEREGLE